MKQDENKAKYCYNRLETSTNKTDYGKNQQ